MVFDLEQRMMVQGFRDRNIFNLVEPFRPIVDGTVIKDQVLASFERGEWHTDKELIIGTTLQEMAGVSTAFQDIGLSFPLRLFEVIDYVECVT